MDPLLTVSKNPPEETKGLWSGHESLCTDKYSRYSSKNIKSLGALIEYAAKTYPGEVGFYYPITSEPNTAYASITWDRFHQLTDVISAEYSDLLRQMLVEANEMKTQPTVALCGHANTIEYYITQMALQKLNIRTLLLAGRNPEAMRSLMERCGALAIIVESGRSYPTDGLLQVPMIEDPFDQLLRSPHRQQILRFDDGQDPWERHTFIIHTSGSTGPPKPIIHTNRSNLSISRRFRVYPDFIVKNWLLMCPLCVSQFYPTLLSYLF